MRCAGYKPREIAEKRNTTRGTTSYQLMNIRRKLRAVLIAALFCLSCAAAFAYSPAGQVIDNQATAAAENDTAAVSNIVSIKVAQIGEPALSGTTYYSERMSNTLYMPVTITNLGNGADSYYINAYSAQGWPAYCLDKPNRQGQLVSVVGVLTEGDSSQFYVALEIPWTTADGDSVLVEGESLCDGTVGGMMVEVGLEDRKVPPGQIKK